MSPVEDSSRKSSILVVDDLPANLLILEKILKRKGYEVRPVHTGLLALQSARSNPPDLILMDVAMPEMDGFETCAELKKDPLTADIPVLFISGSQDTGDKVKAFRAGGVDYVSKPFHEQEVLARIQTHLRLWSLQSEQKSRTVQLERRIAEQVRLITASQMSTIFALAKLAEARDDETGYHVERVQAYSRTLAEGMRDMELHAAQLDGEFMDTLFQASALHDIGKVGIPDAILLKPGKLTPEEFAVMKNHSRIGADTLQAVLQRHPDNQFLRMGVEVARSHHEKWDGSGYPDGLKGNAIPLAARIVALADVYDALTSKRCYRLPVSHEETCRVIGEGNGVHFDPDVVTAFKTLETQFQRVRGWMQNPGTGREEAGVVNPGARLASFGRPGAKP